MCKIKVLLIQNIIKMLTIIRILRTSPLCLFKFQEKRTKEERGWGSTVADYMNTKENLSPLDMVETNHASILLDRINRGGLSEPTDCTFFAADWGGGGRNSTKS